MRRIPILWLSAWLGSLLLAAVEVQADPPARIEPIGGRWYVRPGNPATYFYRDGDRYVDLFSYHGRDSNKDGIPNVKIRHDAR